MGKGLPSITKVTATLLRALPGVHVVSALTSTEALTVVARPRDAVNWRLWSFPGHLRKRAVTSVTSSPNVPVIFAK